MKKIFFKCFLIDISLKRISDGVSRLLISFILCYCLVLCLNTLVTHVYGWKRMVLLYLCSLVILVLSNNVSKIHCVPVIRTVRLTGTPLRFQLTGLLVNRTKGCYCPDNGNLGPNFLSKSSLSGQNSLLSG